jgi:hypothetical protein
MFRQMLLATIAAPAFIRSPGGRRFIAHMFTLFPPFVNELHAAIKVRF